MQWIAKYVYIVTNLRTQGIGPNARIAYNKKCFLCIYVYNYRKPENCPSIHIFGWPAGIREFSTTKIYNNVNNNRSSSLNFRMTRWDRKYLYTKITNLNFCRHKNFPIYGMYTYFVIDCIWIILKNHSVYMGQSTRLRQWARLDLYIIMP